MTSNERHDVLNHRQIDYSVKLLAHVNIKEISRLHVTGPFWKVHWSIKNFRQFLFWIMSSCSACARGFRIDLSWLQYRLTCTRISIRKISRSHDRIISIMGIGIPGKMVFVFKQGRWCEASFTWWRHQMETFSALLAICAGNSPATGEFPARRPVARSFDVYFDLRLNKRSSKQMVRLGLWDAITPIVTSL